MRGRLVLVLGLALVLTLQVASAGTREEPEVRDPANDLRYQGAPVPAGFEWADIRQAWFARPDNATVELTIEVVGTQGPPPRGEVGVTFLAGTQYWIAGWTVFPPLYSGGFLSKSDKQGDVPAGTNPGNAAATWTANQIVVKIPFAAIAGQTNLTQIEEPYGWSESHATQGRMYRLDETAVGSAFSWSEEPMVDEQGPAATEESASTSGFGAAVAFVVLAALASRRRR